MLPDLRPSAVTSPAVGNPAPVRLGPPNRSSLLPGLAVAAAITTLALAINQWQPLLSALLLAIVVGAVVGNVRPIPAVWRPGLSFASKQLLRLGIVSLVSLVIFALLSTLGLRFLVGKFVMEPINELNEEAEGIIAGTFEGEVPYDRDSTFAPIQGLLRSGQKVLKNMDDELGS